MSQKTIDAYNRRASTYEAKWSRYLEHTHQKFLGQIETSPQDLILDVSGGTGLLALELVNNAHNFQELVVNDPSEKMRSIAQHRLKDFPNITFTGYRSDQLSFDPNHFDTILCLNAFHVYTRQQETLRQIYRILKPGGHLYLLDWNCEGIFRIVNKLIKWSVSEQINTRSLPEIKRMLAEAKFTPVRSRHWRWRYWNFLFTKAEK